MQGFRRQCVRSTRVAVLGALLSVFAIALSAAPALAASAPVVAIDPAVTAIGYQTAHVSGTVDPEGGPDEEWLQTSWWFQVSTEPSNPSSWQFNASGSLTEAESDGTTAVSVEGTLQGLQAGTHYAVRLIATNTGWEPFATTAAPYPEFTTVDTTPPAATIAPVTDVTSGSAHFEGTVNPQGTDPAFDVNWHFECTPACPGAPSGYIPADNSVHAVFGDVTGLEPNVAYEVRLVAANAGEQTATDPENFKTVAVPVRVKTIAAFADPGGTTARLGGLIDPQNAPTIYWFEVGTDSGYGRAVPAGEDGDAGSGGSPIVVTQAVDGLTPGQTYHYRLVAQSSQGTVFGEDLTFQTAPAAAGPSACPNAQFREGAAAKLPDCRGLEMVSPPYKNNADAFEANIMASAAGDKIAWTSQGSFAGMPTARGVNLGNYMSARGSGSWSTEAFSPERGLLHFQNGYYGFNEDLSKAYLANREKPGRSLVPGIEEGFNLYLRDNLTKTYTLLNGPKATGYSGFGWASADMSKISFESNQVLTPEAPCDGFSITVCAYEWDNGELRLASVLPDGTPVQGSVANSGVGWPNNNIEDGVSEDGHRLFWNSQVEQGAGTPPNLYAREDGTTTTVVTKSERTLPGGAEGGAYEYLGAEAAHGNLVLFKTSNSMVDEDEDSGSDLYIADLTAPAGQRLTLVSEDRNGAAPEGAGALGFVTRSDDMSRVYFVTENQILPGLPEQAGPKLYLWDNTGDAPVVRYIGLLDAADERIWLPATVGLNSGDKPARISPDGRFTTFRSQGRLTAYDNGGEAEIYLYDAVTDQMSCASCSEDAYPAHGYVGYSAAFSNSSPVTNHVLRNVTDEGRLFFETSKGLIPSDSNGKIDVYEYQGGQVSLISTGTGPEDSRFLDAGRNGDDVFFRTVDQLVGWDVDRNADIYDARVGGGFPEPPPKPAPCEGDACQPPPVVPNDPTPASSGFKGPESPAPRFKKKRKGCHKHNRGQKKCRGKKHGKKNATRKHG